MVQQDSSQNLLNIPVTPLYIDEGVCDNENKFVSRTLAHLKNEIVSRPKCSINFGQLHVDSREDFDIPVPVLQNIVATINLGVQLDLKEIAMKARNAEYNPKRFVALIMRIRDPRTTALIFSSGKMVVTGAKTQEACRLASRKFARIVQKLGFDVTFKEFRIQNIVGSCDIKFPIQLEGLCITHGHFSTYEPELFPGLIYRMVKPRVVLLIFMSGKVVITGAKSPEELNHAFEQIYPILKGFKK